MSLHIADAWRACDQLVRELATRFPSGTFTSVRDVQGRCSFAIDGLSEDQRAQVEAQINGNKELSPYFGPLGIRFDLQDRLRELIHEFRRPLGDLSNAFVVDRLLSNDSWTRVTGSNPPKWPPVVAFYSFKGGVGRTTAAALTGLSLAREGRRVVILDLDLEAPGIEGFFFQGDQGGEIRAGIVDYLLERHIFGAT